MSTWEGYYKKSQSRALRPLYLKALEYLKEGASLVAMDLGCGAGIETMDMLRRGFTVHAVDREQRALDLIIQNQGVNHGVLTNRLHTHTAAFEDFNVWPAVDFIFSYLALPFCEPKHFHEVISKAKSAVNPGGYLAMSFMGPDDDWVVQNKVVGISKTEIEKKLAARFEIVYINETREYGMSSLGGEKLWHLIKVVAKKTVD